MSYTNNSFFTQSYKQGYIHTWMTQYGEKAQAQLGQVVKEFPTVAGCKRWITKQLDNTTPPAEVLNAWANGDISVNVLRNTDGSIDIKVDTHCRRVPQPEITVLFNMYSDLEKQVSL